MLWNKLRHYLRRKPYKYEILSEKLQDEVYEDQYASEQGESIERVDLVKTQDFKAVFGSGPGRRVLFHLMQAANMYSAVPNEENLVKIEGRRELIYMILRRLNTR